MRDKIDQQIVKSASTRPLCKADLILAVRKTVVRSKWTINRRIDVLASQGLLALDRGSEKGRTFVTVTDQGKLALRERAAAQAEEA